MRPLNETEGQTKAVMWRADTWGNAWNNSELGGAIWAYAHKRHRFAGTAKLSAIDKRYYLELWRWTGQGGVYHMNIAMGTGTNPLEAALDAFRKVEPDIMWAVFQLEIEVEKLRRVVLTAAAQEKRLDQVLDQLATLVRSVTVARPAAPGEDDDL